MHGPGKRHGTTIGMPQHNWRFDTHLPGSSGQQFSLLADRGAGAANPVGVAQTRTIEHRNAIAFSQARGEAVCHVTDIAAGPMYQNQIWTVPHGDGVYAVAINLKELPLGWKLCLGAGFMLARAVLDISPKQRQRDQEGEKDFNGQWHSG